MGVRELGTSRQGKPQKRGIDMKCPKCKKEIKFARVYSECWQKGYFQKGTNVIQDYGEIGETTETIAIECPECSYDLMPKGEVEV